MTTERRWAMTSMKLCSPWHSWVSSGILRTYFEHRALFQISMLQKVAGLKRIQSEQMSVALAIVVIYNSYNQHSCQQPVYVKPMSDVFVSHYVLVQNSCIMLCSKCKERDHTEYTAYITDNHLNGTKPSQKYTVYVPITSEHGIITPATSLNISRKTIRHRNQ